MLPRLLFAIREEAPSDTTNTDIKSIKEEYLTSCFH